MKKLLLILLPLIMLSCQTKTATANANIILSNEDFTYITFPEAYKDKISDISIFVSYNKKYCKMFAKIEVLDTLYQDMIKDENFGELDVKMEIEDTIQKIDQLDPIKDFHGKNITFVPEVIEKLTIGKEKLNKLIK